MVDGQKRAFTPKVKPKFPLNQTTVVSGGLAPLAEEMEQKARESAAQARGLYSLPGFCSFDWS